MINIISSSRYKINRKLVKESVNEVLTTYSIPGNALFNIIFIGKKKMKGIAAKYKNEDVALPVLSFAYSTPGVVQINESEKPLGEVFICYPQAILLAAERGKKVDDIMKYLIKHGLENILK